MKKLEPWQIRDDGIFFACEAINELIGKVEALETRPVIPKAAHAHEDIAHRLKALETDRSIAKVDKETTDKDTLEIWQRLKALEEQIRDFTDEDYHGILRRYEALEEKVEEHSYHIFVDDDGDVWKIKGNGEKVNLSQKPLTCGECASYSNGTCNDPDGEESGLVLGHYYSHAKCFKPKEKAPTCGKCADWDGRCANKFMIHRPCHPYSPACAGFKPKESKDCCKAAEENKESGYLVKTRGGAGWWFGAGAGRLPQWLISHCPFCGDKL